MDQVGRSLISAFQEDEPWATVACSNMTRASTARRRVYAVPRCQLEQHRSPGGAPNVMIEHSFDASPKSSV